TSPDYFALGRFMKEMADLSWISAKDLIGFEKRNGVTEFCAAILKKSPDSLTNNDIELVASAFQLVRENIQNTTSQLQRIIEQRGETGKYQFK
ncbi:MAG: hypothetical protein Q7R93_00720, partial [bacterium]|nr:hypothetical protein [bacterium]